MNIWHIDGSEVVLVMDIGTLCVLVSTSTQCLLEYTRNVDPVSAVKHVGSTASNLLDQMARHEVHAKLVFSFVAQIVLDENVFAQVWPHIGDDLLDLATALSKWSEWRGTAVSHLINTLPKSGRLLQQQTQDYVQYNDNLITLLRTAQG